MGLYLKKNSKMLIKPKIHCCDQQQEFHHFRISGDILPEKNPSRYTEDPILDVTRMRFTLDIRFLTVLVSTLQNNVKPLRQSPIHFHSVRAAPRPDSPPW